MCVIIIKLTFTSFNDLQLHMGQQTRCHVQGVPINMGIFSDEFDIVLVRISIVIPNFKSHNITMSDRVYFMKTVNGCKDVSIMSSQDVQ